LEWDFFVRRKVELHGTSKVFFQSVERLGVPVVRDLSQKEFDHGSALEQNAAE